MTASWAFAKSVIISLHELSHPCRCVLRRPQGSRRLFPDSAERVAAARSAATRTALLAVTAGQALLMAFALKLKIAAALRNREAARRAGAITDGHDDPAAAVTTLDARAPRAAAGRSVFLTYCRALGRDSSVAAVVDAMAVQGLGWAPTLCNLAVLAAFAAGLAVNASLTGAPEAVFMLAPVLLMLSQVRCSARRACCLSG